MIASQLVVPFSGIVLGANTMDGNFPRRQVNTSFEPIIESKAAFVLDMKTGKVLYQKNGYEKRSIASLTKLLTALVFLETDPDWSKNVTVTQDDRVNGGVLVLKPGEVVNLKDLFRLSLVASVNNATMSLANSTELSYAEFIERMNLKAREIGMKESSFYEPTGIDERNQAAAEDVAHLLRSALNDSLIRETLLTERYEFYTVSGKFHGVNNSNKLLKSYLRIEGGKTGYIDEAGYCLANLVKSDQAKEGIVVVILGASSKEQRFQENKFLSQWVFDNWAWE